MIEECAGEAFREIPRGLWWLGTVVNLAYACESQADEARAAELDALLEPMDSLHGVLPGALLYAGSIVGARGRVLEVLGRNREAKEAYERAVVAERSVGASHVAAASQRRLDRLRGWNVALTA